MRSLICEVSLFASFNCSFGQLYSVSHMNCGAVNHLDFLLNYGRGISRVPSSAGFRGAEQNFH